MCGFAGFAGLDREPNLYLDDIRRMLRAIAHRGRDEMGYFVDDQVALATVRLAIIDLRMGKQPMPDTHERYWVGFNGEIFNYLELRAELEAVGVTFRTLSDTEVLCQALATWGDDALNRLNGQFGFAFYDSLTARLVLGRDRFGERPVFYARYGHGLVFASEIKGILALPFARRELSTEGLAQAYRYFSPLPPTTPFEGVSSLPPGHMAVFEQGQLDISSYYTFPRLEEPFITDPGDAIDAIRAALTESVRLRLRSDYEVGAYVSGGIDSAAITSLARGERSERFRTFSAVMDDPRLDESRYQQAVSDALDTEHVNVRVTGDDIRDLFPTVVYQAEAPLFRTAAAASYRLAQVTHEAGMRVVLAGEGGDEMFLGYDVFKEAWLVENFDMFADDSDRIGWLDRALSDARTTKSVDAEAVVGALRKWIGTPYATAAPHLRRFGDEAVGARFLIGEVEATPWEDELLRAMRALDSPFADRTTMERAQMLDIITLLSGYGLAYQSDRAGTQHSLEARFPFLDPNVVAVAWSIAPNLRLPGGHREKEILKQAFVGLVPEEVVRRPKQAFRAPGAEYLRRNGADDWVAATLSDERLQRSAVVDPVRARQLVDIVHTDDGPMPYPAKHGYALLLSTLLLEECLVDDFRLPDVDVETHLVRREDRRTAALR